MLGLQSELAETVAREIAIQLTPTEATQLAQRGTPSIRRRTSSS